MTPNPQLDDFLHALAPAKTRRIARGVMVTCWGHDDHNPSTETWVDDKGKISFHCWAGCTHQDLTRQLPPQAHTIAAATWGLTGTPPRILLPTHRPTPPTTPQGAAQARYDYTTTGGDLLFYKLRHPGKKFTQHQPDGTPGRGDAQPVLYRLPDIAAAIKAGDPIIVVEGEKDADRLAAAGFTATTNPDGAGTWRTHHTDTLTGAHIVVIPDNDDPGHKHALDIVDHVTPIAATVRYLTLEVGAKGDISDWFDNRHTPNELAELIAKTPTIQQAAPPGLYANWDTIWDLDTGSWLIEPILLEGRSHAIYAGAKTGKSLITLWMLVDALRKDPTLVVLYLDYEMGAIDLVERLRAMGVDGHHPFLDRLHYAMFPPIPPLDTEAGADQLVAMCDIVAAQHPGGRLLLVVDTISRAVKGKENDSDTYRDYYRHTGMALKARGYTAVRLDHTGKDKSLGQRGSSAKNDDVDIVWELKRDPEDGTATLTPILQRVGNLKPVRYGYLENPVRFVPTEQSVITPSEHDLAVKAWLLGVRSTMNQREAEQHMRDNYPPNHRDYIKNTDVRKAYNTIKRVPGRDWGNAAPPSETTRQEEAF